MHKLIAGMTLSLDGFVNDHNGDVSVAQNRVDRCTEKR